MSVIVITSPGDAPGATTTALALTLSWPGRLLLAECSPTGGKILRGYFQCHTPVEGGLWESALAAVQGPDAAANELWQNTIPLDEQRLLLPGLIDPFLAAELPPEAWENLAATFAALPFTVLADAGPIGPAQPFALMRASELVLVVLRPTLAQVAAARPRLARLRQALGPLPPLGLCVIGDRPYTPRDVRAELGDFALTIALPDDRRAAAVLSDGGGSDWTRRKIELTNLMRSARTAGQTLTTFTEAQPRLTAPPSAGRRKG